MSERGTSTTKVIRAVIMAGGEGQRLRPFTNTIPKPLLPIGRKPIAQVIIERLKSLGFTNVTMALGYGADLVRAYFRDGSQFGLSVDYYEEHQKLGTAGALAKIPGLKDTPAFLVTNGDVLTDLDYSVLLSEHIASGNIMTVSTIYRDMVCPYGIIEADKDRLTSIKEKPKFEFIANAGIYALSAHALNFIPEKVPFDMTELIQILNDNDQPVGVKQIEGFWFDLATVDDFDKASAQLSGFLHE